MDFATNDVDGERNTPTPTSSKGGWEAVDLPEGIASPEDSERQIRRFQEEMSGRCQKVRELCADIHAQLQDSPQGEIHQQDRAYEPAQQAQEDPEEEPHVKLEQELLPLWAGLGGWIDPLARTMMVLIACALIFVAGLSSIVLAASLFYLVAGVIKGRFTVSPPVMDAPPLLIELEVLATPTPGSSPGMINLTEVARRHGNHPCAFLRLVQLLNNNTAGFPAPAPAQPEQQTASGEGWYDLYARYMPSGEHVGLLILFLIVVGPKLVNAISKWYTRNTEESRRYQEECRKRSLQAPGGLQELTLAPRTKVTTDGSRENIALMTELDFNKAKTHKLLGSLEKWDQVKFLRVNEPQVS